jgi:hypothetical protein
MIGRGWRLRFQSSARPFLPPRLHIFNAAIHRCQTCQHQEEQGIRGRVQREIKKAVNQYGETPGHRSSGYAPPEVIAGLSPGKSHAKQVDKEKQSDNSANDSAIRQHLEIIVVSLFKTINSITRIVSGVNDAESAQPSA